MCLTLGKQVQKSNNKVFLKNNVLEPENTTFGVFRL